MVRDVWWGMIFTYEKCRAKRAEESSKSWVEVGVWCLLNCLSNKWEFDSWFMQFFFNQKTHLGSLNHERKVRKVRRLFRLVTRGARKAGQLLCILQKVNTWEALGVAKDKFHINGDRVGVGTSKWLWGVAADGESLHYAAESIDCIRVIHVCVLWFNPWHYAMLWFQSIGQKLDLPIASPTGFHVPRISEFWTMTITPWKFNISPLEISHLKRKGSFSYHHFSVAIGLS